jgi:hypothetical protein
MFSFLSTAFSGVLHKIVSKNGFGASLFVVSVGCAHTVKLESFPQGSTVSVVTTKSGKEVFQNLGKTPLLLPKSNFDSDSLVLEIGSGGYLKKRVIVPLVDAGDLKIFTNLEKVDKEWFLDQMHGGFSQSFSESLQDLLRLSAAITARNSKQVDAFIKDYGSKYENISVYHVLLGHREVFEGRLDSARKYYLHALDLEPKNSEAQEVLNQLDGNVEGSRSLKSGVKK